MYLEFIMDYKKKKQKVSFFSKITCGNKIKAITLR